jgi:hypothetical protein
MAAQRRGFFQRIGDFFAGIFGRRNESTQTTGVQERRRGPIRMEPCLGQLPTGIPCTAQVELDDKRATACTMCGTPATANCINCNKMIRGGQHRCSTCGAEQFGTCHACGKRLSVGVYECDRCRLAELQQRNSVSSAPRTQPIPANTTTVAQPQLQPRPANIPNGVPIKQVEYEDF